MKKLLFGILFCLCVISCTEQERAYAYGGTVKIELEPGEKLVECTWKDSRLWYLVEPMDSDYVPKTKYFKESDPWGLTEGKVIFIEKR